MSIQLPKPISTRNDNETFITQGAITRLARKGGVLTMTKLCYEETRGLMKEYLTKVLKGAYQFMQNARRRRLQSYDVRESLKIIGRTPVYTEGTEVKRKYRGKKVGKDGTLEKKTRVVKNYPHSMTTNCHLYQSKRKAKNIQIGGADVDGAVAGYDHDGAGDGYMLDDEETYDPQYDDEDSDEGDPIDESYGPIDDQINDENEGQIEGYDISHSDSGYYDPNQLGGAKKPYKFKPGTVANRQIKYYQKQPGRCFNVAKAGFRRIVMNILTQFYGYGSKNNVPISKEALIMLQLDCENYLVEIFNKCQKLADHRQHARVSDKDIRLINALMK